MIKNKNDLEERVLEYSPELKARIEGGDLRARSELERIADKEYMAYSPFIKEGVSGKTGKGGRALGYLGDVVFWGSAVAAAVNPLLAPYMLTGLLLKKGNLVAQLPESLRSLRYGLKTGDFVGAGLNIGAKALSYVPGLTLVDKGLSKIAQRRMVRKTAYEVNESLGIEKKSWYNQAGEEAKEAGYIDARVRAENIVGPSRKHLKRELKKAA